MAINFALSQALLTKKVDATIGAFRNFEMNQMELAGEKGRPIFPEDEGVPAYDELIFIAQKDKIHDPRIAAFLDALERGVQYLVNHPEDSWNAFIAAHPDLNDELNKRAWRDTLPRFALRPAALDVARYRRFADYLVGQPAPSKSAPPVDSYAADVR